MKTIKRFIKGTLNKRNFIILFRALKKESLKKIVNNGFLKIALILKLARINIDKNPVTLFHFIEKFRSDTHISLRGIVVSNSRIKKIIITNSEDESVKINFWKARKDFTSLFHENENIRLYEFSFIGTFKEKSTLTIVTFHDDDYTHRKRIKIPSKIKTVNFDNHLGLIIQSNIENKESIISECISFQYRPLISIITPVYNVDSKWLDKCIESVINQYYDNWQLCLYDDFSTNNETLRCLQKWQNIDTRISIGFGKENLGISNASNMAIEMVKGEYIALLDNDDALTPDAIYWFVKEINKNKNLQIIYSDECKINEFDELLDAFVKPDWSPELLINMMYTGHLTVYNYNFLVDQVGFFRSKYDFSQDYDLMLRASEKAEHIHHIPKILYHWRAIEGSAAQGDKPYARETNIAALDAAMKRRNVRAEILPLPSANRAKLTSYLKFLVSIIIPSDSIENISESIESIVSNTNYENYEIVVVTKTSLIKRLQKIFSDKRIKFSQYDLPFNFSDKCNTGAQTANGDILIFYNDDVRPMQEDWVQELIEFLSYPDVGGVSPKLVYENDTIQYAGMATGVRNVLGTTFHCYHKDSTEYHNYPQLVRNVSVLSGACLAITKKLFDKIEGFNIEDTPIAHSDTEISFKIGRARKKCLYTPYATLRHIGHQAIGAQEKKKTIFKKDKADIYLLKNWCREISYDPFFTDEMRGHLYHDSPEYFRIFAPQKQEEYGSKGDIIVFSHDLSRSGAPIHLFDLCYELLKEGYFVTVMSPKDGPLRNNFIQIGIPIIIDELVLQQHHTTAKFAQNFDLAIFNTIVTWPVARLLNNKLNYLWWIHEGKVIEQFAQNKDCQEQLKNSKNLVVISDYSKRILDKYNKNSVKIRNAIPDIDSEDIRDHNPFHDSEKFNITLIGSIEPRKGQDLLLNSLRHIDSSYRSKVRVNIVGRTLDKKFKKMLHEIDFSQVEVNFIGEVSKEESRNIIHHSDLIVNTSRDEPFSLTLVEAFCLQKACLVSNKTGIVELIEEGVNAFTFLHEDYKDLGAQMNSILSSPSDLKNIGRNARTTYDNNLTMGKALQSWIMAIEKEMKIDHYDDRP